MLKRIFILFVVYATVVYTAAAFTTYLSNKGEAKAYADIESAFNHLQNKLEKNSSLATELSPKEIKRYSGYVVYLEKYENDNIKPNIMKMYHEKIVAFSHELAKKNLISIEDKAKQQKHSNNNNMEEYLNDARVQGGKYDVEGNVDQLNGFMKNLSDIDDKVGGYKIQKSEFLFSLSLIGFGAILLVIIIIFAMILLSEGIPPHPEVVVKVATYLFLVLSIVAYLIYLLGIWGAYF